MPAGLPKIEVKFSLDTDGILNVKAKELRSGVEQTLIINPKEKLSDEIVEKSLSDSMIYAEQDKEQRSILEAKSEATVLAETTRSFISKNETDLTVEENDKLAEYTSGLEKAIESGTQDEILKASDQLNEYSRPIAERVMNNAIKISLSGKKI